MINDDKINRDICLYRSLSVLLSIVAILGTYDIIHGIKVNGANDSRIAVLCIVITYDIVIIPNIVESIIRVITAKDCKTYVMAHDRMVIYLKNLSKTSNKSIETLKQEFKRMIKYAYIPDAYIDNKNLIVFINKDDYKKDINGKFS